MFDVDYLLVDQSLKDGHVFVLVSAHLTSIFFNFVIEVVGAVSCGRLWHSLLLSLS